MQQNRVSCLQHGRRDFDWMYYTKAANLVDSALCKASRTSLFRAMLHSSGGDA